MIVRYWVWLTMLVIGCARHQSVGPAALSGPDRVELPMYRNPGAADKVFVEVSLGDRTPRLFLIDTGAAVTAVSDRVAQDLALSVKRQPGSLVGVAGSTPWSAALLPELSLGRHTLQQIPVAVGVTGVPTQVGLVPLDGILGNDVLDRFRVTVDYPANRLVLERSPGSPMPKTASALFYNGQHPMVKTTMTVRNDAGITVEQPVLFQLDTGTRGVVLRGGGHEDLAAVSTPEEQLVRGVGSARAERRPAMTVPIVRIPMGGAVIDTPIRGVWLDHDHTGRRHAPELNGLIGFAGLQAFRVVIDYRSKQFALLSATDTRPTVDVHAWYIDRGRPNPIDRVKALVVLNRPEDAERLLTKLARHPARNPEAAILHARMKRTAGAVDEAIDGLQGVPMHALVTSGEIIAMVNTMWLRGDTEKAGETAYLATVLEPDLPAAWVAMADLHLSTGDITKARRAVAEAVNASGDPDAYRIRRALIAWMDSDVDGAMTHLRNMIANDPVQGFPQWLYAQVADTDDRLILAAHDLRTAQARVSADRAPFDFAAGAWFAVGNTAEAESSWKQGISRDCDRARTEQSRDNCLAWYQVLIGKDLADAEAKVRSALSLDPNRSEYLDTLAMVLEAQGRASEARDASWKAALQQPGDVYLIAQALRLQQRAQSKP
ncbi:MAG: aspartyl protease family protein [Myxococcota bacterium]|nr:aspartyl protease family protein [Myxococcota bacterium]